MKQQNNKYNHDNEKQNKNIKILFYIHEIIIKMLIQCLTTTSPDGPELRHHCTDISCACVAGCRPTCVRAMSTDCMMGAGKQGEGAGRLDHNWKIIYLWGVRETSGVDVG